MRNLRSFEVEPWLRSAGQQVWTRIRRGLVTQEQELHENLQQEVEQLRAVRNNAQRATQLARVLDAVYAIAEAHELTETQLSGLREVKPASRAVPVMELARKLETRAVQVLDQMLGAEPVQPRAALTALSVRADGYGLDALVSWLTPRVISDALPEGWKPQPTAAAKPSVRARADEKPSAPRPRTRTEPPPSAAAETVPPPPAARADVSLARSGIDAARASLQLSSNELSLRLRITHQAAQDAMQWFSQHRRNELAMWLLSKSAQLVLRKVILPQLARIDLSPQLLLRVALASGSAQLPKKRRASLPARAARRVKRAVTPRLLLRG